MQTARILLSILGAGVVLSAGIAGAAFVAWNQSQYTSGFVMLTAEEIAIIRDPAPPLKRGIQMTLSNGPEIQVSAPKGDALVSPVDIDIWVAPKDGVPVDMSTIKIEYRLGPTWINMTRRVMNYASVQGPRLFAKGAELPVGRHALRVSVQDTADRTTQATVSFSVTD